MEFLEPSVLIVLAKNNREMANYESDTVRTAPLAAATGGKAGRGGSADR
jgi:hypothetical protein